MTFRVSFSEEIKPQPNGSPVKVVLPISMENTKEGSGKQTGDKLKAQIEELKSLGCDITVLVADELLVHNFRPLNFTDEEEKNARSKARGLGDKFIRDNADNKSSLTQTELDSEAKTITISGCPVKRWRTYTNEQADELKKTKQIIESCCETENSEFLRILKDTYKEFKLQHPKENISEKQSFRLQIEEYAVILLMKYDLLIYPKLTPGLAFVCSKTNFTTFKNKPKFLEVNFLNIKNEFAEKVKEAKTIPSNSSLPDPLTSIVALQSAVLSQMAMLLSSPQIAQAHKQNLARQLRSLFVLYEDVIRGIEVNEAAAQINGFDFKSDGTKDKENILSQASSISKSGMAVSAVQHTQEGKLVAAASVSKTTENTLTLISSHENPVTVVVAAESTPAATTTEQSNRSPTLTRSSSMLFNDRSNAINRVPSPCDSRATSSARVTISQATAR